jgi:hypothetical protein
MAERRFSLRVRLFLAAGLVCALHFATNVVREHYPAFALVDHGDLRCDPWAGLSPDLFRHKDGHWYANHQVGAALLAAPVLFILEPLLHRLEEVGRRQAAESRGPFTYATEYPARARFMAAVRARGLHLRFGAAAAATAVLVMAPAAGLLVVMIFELLRRRGVAEHRAALLALLSLLATPLVYRSAILNQNQLEAVALFAAFFVLHGDDRPGEAPRATTPLALFGAGLLAGAALLMDSSGVVGVAALALDVALRGRRPSERSGSRRALLDFGAGVSVPLSILFATQYWSFGNPFLPAQHWMPATDQSRVGWHGIALPDASLFGRSLSDPSYGLFAFAPLLLLAFARPRAGTPAVVARGERRWILLFGLAFLLFNSMNRYFELQWNTGFRSLAPLVPFLFLLACDGLARVKGRTLALVAIPCALHGWVLALARATPPFEPQSFAESTIARSWQALFTRGIELPWLTVWRETQPGGGPAWARFLSIVLVAGAGALVVLLLRAKKRAA